MKTAAVIAEYNPFHNGHSRHLKEARALTGADFVMASHERGLCPEGRSGGLP